MRVSIPLLGVAFLWLGVWDAATAACSGSTSTNSYFTLPASLSAKRNEAVGKVLYDSGWISDGTRAYVSCSGSYALTAGFTSAMTAVSGMSGTYATGVPGLGIKIDYNNTGAWYPATGMRWPRTSESFSGSAVFTPWGWFRVQYIVTGPLSSGTMNLPNPTATVLYGGVLTNKVTFSRTSVNVLSTGCRVLNGDIAVSLPDIAASAFTAVGATPASRDFSIDLTCDADVAVSYRIDATPPAGVPATSGVIAAASSAGQATGVGVRISSRGSIVPLGSKLSYLRTTSAGQAVGIPLTGAYYATALPVGGGALNAVATFSLFYE